MLAFIESLKIRWKFLFVCTVAILFTALTIGILSYFIYRRIVVDNTVNYSKDFTKQLANNISNELTGVAERQFTEFKYAEILDLLTEKVESRGHLAIQKRTISTFLDYFLANSLIDSVIILAADGTLFDPGSLTQTPEQTAQLAGLIRTVELDKTSGRPLWIAGENADLYMVRNLLSLEPNFTSVGSTILRVHLPSLLKKINYSDFFTNKNIVLVDKDGIPCLPAAADFDGLITYVEQKNSGPVSSSPLKEEFRGREYIISIESLEPHDMQLYNISVVKDLLISQNLLALWIVGICALAFTVAELFAGRLSRAMTRNIHTLVSSIQDYVPGNFSKMDIITAKDEIGLVMTEFNKMAEKIDTLVRDVYRSELEKQSSEYKALQFEYNALQSKINPHFLYNTLETINSMAKLGKRQEISDVACLLGELLHDNLRTTAQTIPLQDEIRHVDKYLQIHKINFGNHLETMYDLEDGLMMAMVPKFILQPIVENAIIHGLDDMVDRGRIEIGARCESGNLVVEVRDNGRGMDEELQKSILSGQHEESVPGETRVRIGLKSVHKRIQILFGESYGLSISSEPDRGCKIKLILPLVFEAVAEEVNPVSV
jgi:two-component system sensor histidine kinase YesM